MKSCCENKCEELELVKGKQAKVLKIVFLLNLAMFFVEFIYGLKASSSALKADSLDMLGDAFVYGFSLYALFKTSRTKNLAALIKGLIMLAFGSWVLIDCILKYINQTVPEAYTMSLVALLALAVNSLCLYLLFRHKDDDLNMKSTWMCSRNDIITNCGTMIAGFCVMYFSSIWPDIIVGVVISALFLHSSFHVIREARAQLK